jgi:hypothetical protein
MRYNFRVLMFHNWWLLVIPLAVSQLTVFWTATTQQFIPMLPANIVERVSPLLAAFLCAHILTSEYRTGIGAVLACKPIDISKVVLMRFSIAIALVWALGWLSLVAFSQALEPFPMLEPGLAMMVSSLFLALLALTFATLFRHPLSGFGVAALYWALDLPSGSPIHPYLTLRSLTASFPIAGLRQVEPLVQSWWISKILLLAAAVTLYLLHRNLVFTLGSPMTLRKRRRTLAWAFGLIAFYMVSGATVKVVYGIRNMGNLEPNDVGWFRRQFAPFSPLPMPLLFGKNFQRYVGNIPSSWRVQQEGESDILGDTVQHRNDLKYIVEKAPNSVWAASSASLLARLYDRSGATMAERERVNRVVVDRYPQSPYAPYCLQAIGRAYSDGMAQYPEYEAKAKAAYTEFLQKFPTNSYASDAVRFLAESARRAKNLSQAEEYAKKWIELAPIQERFLAYSLRREILNEAGKSAEAKAEVELIRQSIAEFRKAARNKTLMLSEPRRIFYEQEASRIEQKL